MKTETSKGMRMDGEDMLSMLNELIFDGWEFPEALDRVSSYNNLTGRQTALLKEDYDEQD